MRMRRAATAALLTAGILVPAVSTAAVAFASPSKHTSSAAKSTHKPEATPKPKATPKPTKTPKAQKPVRFTASGTVTAVDAEAGTVTLVVKGGTKDVRKSTLTVTVPAKASVRVNSKKATVAALAAGFRIEVTGRRAGAVYTVDVLRATGKKAKPAPSVTPSPTTEPTDEPTTEPTTEPTDEPTTEPTDEPSTEPTVAPSADPAV
ncbi:hypothetical protein [Actinoplanes sp. NPDC049681]|uniref:hypothetical protein n=1 Tax=Actinoplanes sp. NPDC049681 TaxID=3363905 RepID=UPI0037ACEF81